MNPFLKLAQQSNVELQDVIKTSRRSQRRAPDEILREAREKHNHYKNYVANGNHKSGVRQIGMSRIQFGDGDFVQSVQELMRFQEPEPRPEPLPEIETPVQLTRTLSRTLRPGETLRSSASSCLFRRATSSNGDQANHRNPVSLTSTSGGDVNTTSDHILDPDDTNGAGLEADNTVYGEASFANSQRSRPKSLGATTFTRAFLGTASQLPEVGKRASFDTSEVGKRASIDMPEVGKRASIDMSEVGKRMSIGMSEVGKRVSIDRMAARQLRSNSAWDMSASATLDSSNACSVQATRQADESPKRDGGVGRWLSMPNAPHLHPQPAVPGEMTDYGGSKKGAAFLNAVLRRRPSGLTNPGESRAVTFASRAQSFTSSGVLDSSSCFSTGAAIKAAAYDDAAATGLTSPTGRRSQYARLDVVLPGSAAAIAAAAGSVPQVPSISGCCPAGSSSHVARQLQPPSTERTDRLLRVLLQEQPRRISNGNFLSASSSSNVSMDGDAVRQRFSIGRMRHPSWRLGDKSGEASDWVGSDGGRSADGASPGTFGNGFNDSAPPYSSSSPLSAGPVVHNVNMRRMTGSHESSGSPKSAPSSPSTSGTVEVPNDMELKAVNSASIPRAGDLPSVLACAQPATGTTASETEQLIASASVPVRGAAGGRRTSGTALTGWSSQQRQPDERERKPRHTAPSGESFTDAAAMQRLALAQLARAIEAGTSTGVKRLEGDKDEDSGSDDDHVDAADLALALLSKSAAGIAGRDGGPVLNVRGLLLTGMIAVKSKEKGWKR